MRSPAKREPQDIQPGFATLVAGILVSSVATSALVATVFWSFHASTDVIGYAAAIALVLALGIGVAVNSR